jgi:hypothetical protein
MGKGGGGGGVQGKKFELGRPQNPGGYGEIGEERGICEKTISRKREREGLKCWCQEKGYVGLG